MVLLQGNWIYCYYILKSIVQKLDPAERTFWRIWPFIENIEGWLVSPHQERWMFKIARALPKGSNIVEIGSFKGRSTCCFAFGCRGRRKHVFAIDTFSGNDTDFILNEFFNDFWNNIKMCGLMDCVTPIRGLSSEVSKTWHKPIHLLYIDGSHLYENVLEDFEQYYPHVVPGGMVVFHDVQAGFPGVDRVWEEVGSLKLVDIGRCSTIAFGKKPK
jgi:hypothetical protein